MNDVTDIPTNNNENILTQTSNVKKGVSYKLNNNYVENKMSAYGKYVSFLKAVHTKLTGQSDPNIDGFLNRILKEGDNQFRQPKNEDIFLFIQDLKNQGWNLGERSIGEIYASLYEVDLKNYPFLKDFVTVENSDDDINITINKDFKFNFQNPADLQKDNFFQSFIDADEVMQDAMKSEIFKDSLLVKKDIYTIKEYTPYNSQNVINTYLINKLLGTTFFGTDKSLVEHNKVLFLEQEYSPEVIKFLSFLYSKEISNSTNKSDDSYLFNIKIDQFLLDNKDEKDMQVLENRALAEIYNSKLNGLFIKSNVSKELNKFNNFKLTYYQKKNILEKWESWYVTPENLYRSIKENNLEQLQARFDEINNGLYNLHVNDITGFDQFERIEEISEFNKKYNLGLKDLEHADIDELSQIIKEVKIELELYESSNDELDVQITNMNNKSELNEQNLKQFDSNNDNEVEDDSFQSVNNDNDTIYNDIDNEKNEIPTETKEELFVKGAFLKRFLTSSISNKMEKCQFLHYRDFLAREVDLNMPGLAENIKNKIKHFIYNCSEYDLKAAMLMGLGGVLGIGLAGSLGLTGMIGIGVFGGIMVGALVGYMIKKYYLDPEEAVSIYKTAITGGDFTLEQVMKVTDVADLTSAMLYLNSKTEDVSNKLAIFNNIYKSYNNESNRENKQLMTTDQNAIYSYILNNIHSNIIDKTPEQYKQLVSEYMLFHKIKSMGENNNNNTFNSIKNVIQNNQENNFQKLVDAVNPNIDAKTISNLKISEDKAVRARRKTTVN